MSEMAYLEDVCEILDNKRIPVTAKDRKLGKYPYYGANGIQDYVDGYIFDDELVLLAEDGGNFGSKDRPIAYRVSGKCWVNNHAHVLKAKQVIDVDYLCYSLMFYDVSTIVNGATRQKLNQSDMRKMKIPLPPLNEQKHIVDVLDKVTDLITQSKRQLELLTELVKARFVEMFGDPIANNYKWKEVSVGDICFVTKLAGFEYTDYIHYRESGDVIMVRGLNVKNMKLKLDDVYYIDSYTSDKLPRSQLKENDIVMTYIGVNIGDVALVDGRNRYHLAPNVAKISPYNYENLNSLFLVNLLSFNKENFASNATNTAKQALNMDKIRKLKVMLPPLELQNKFADFVEQIDKSKSQIQKSLKQLETLKKALMQKYFG